MKTRKTHRFGAIKLSLPQARRLGSVVSVRERRYRLAGEVHSVYGASAADGAWTAGSLRVEGVRELVGFVARNLGGIEVGRVIDIEGYWDDHETYGVQYHIEQVFRSELPRQEQALIRYMSANIPGVGPRRAAHLMRCLGASVLETLLTKPDLPKQYWPGAAGEQVVLGVRQWIRATGADRWSVEVAPKLMAVGQIGYAVARRICNYFSSAEVANLIVRREPYRLLEVPGIGWKSADAIARSLGVAEDDPERASGAVLWTFGEQVRDGHSALRRSDLVQAALQYMPGQVKRIRRAIVELALDGEIIRSGGLLYRERPLLAEWNVADLMHWLLGLDRSLGAGQGATIERLLAASHLTGEQKSAVRMALGSAISVMTGGPGTGKTTTLRMVIEACRALGLPVQVVAPTGKAASRTSEVTGVRAVTVHKLLGGPPGSEREAGPIRCGLLIVEEASMLDLEVFAWLAANIRPGPDFRLLIVGDANQLPSVGHGQVLADLIASGAIPVTELTQIRRQEEDSTITIQAHRLLRGKPLDLSEAYDFRFVELPTNAHKAQDAVLRAVRRVVQEERSSIVRKLDERPFNPCSDLQVLTPRKAGPIGIEELNPLLRSHLNPYGQEGPWISGGTRACEGDRVMCIENDYSIGYGGLMNGEQGVVSAIEPDAISLCLDDGRTVQTRGDVQNGVLALAFAATVHKSQGSEYPVVVVVFHSSQYPLLDRRLLYTALTRAKSRVILCADREALRMAEDGHAAMLRTTGLARRLRMLNGRQ